MNLLIIGLAQLTAAVLIIIITITAIIKIIRIKKHLILADKKMLNTARIFSWGAVIIIILINNNLEKNIFYLIFLIILLIIYIGSTRLYVISYLVENENMDGSSYPLDQIDRCIIKLYKKYLEPLWKDREVK